MNRNRKVLRHAAAALFALVAGAPAWAQTFPLPAPGNDVVGEVRSIETRYEDTLLDIARRFDLGYEELLLANPGVDPWLPGEGTIVVLPTRYILPPVPREGIVLNIPEMRLYYYPKPRAGEAPVVVTHPVSIGRDQWITPTASTSVVAKTKDPAWYPPESIRAEHAAEGDILPKVVPAGPNNPLGRFALRLGISGYLIHGTNKPYALGMRNTHGCMRLYPEDIETMFHRVPVGTPVRIINQPYKAGWSAGVLYLEAHPPLSEDQHVYQGSYTPLVKVVVDVTQERANGIDWDLAQQVADHPSGIPLSIMPGGATRMGEQSASANLAVTSAER